MSEFTPDGWHFAGTSYDAQTGITVENTEATTDVKVTKKWVGTQGDSAIVTLLADGKDTSKRLTLTADMGWQGSFTDLPKYAADGHEIAYTVAEPHLDNYVSKVSGNAKDGFTLVNTEATQVGVQKFWPGSGFSDKQTVTFRLYANGVDTGKTVTIEPEYYSEYHYIEDVPKYDDAGKLIDYTLVEENVPEGYCAFISGGYGFDTGAWGDISFFATNVKKDTALNVKKYWYDANGKQVAGSGTVTLHLLANGKDTGKSVTVSQDNDWTAPLSFADLPATDESGKTIEYTLSEDAVAGYATEVLYNSTANEIVVQNTPTISIPVTKSWSDGPTGSSATIALYANDKDTGKRLTLNESNGWSGSFTDVPAVNTWGNSINYSVKEINVPAGYKPSISGNTSRGFTISNSYAVPISIDFQKKWVGDKEASATFGLYFNGEYTGWMETITALDGWKGSFAPLPKYDYDGNPVNFTVKEINVPEGYDAVESGSAETGYTFTNISTQTTSVPVVKVWDDADDQLGNRPDNVVVHLYADGQDTGQQLTLDTSNEWTGAFNDLRVYDAADGHAIAYSVKEDKVAGYAEATISGSAAEGFTVTNASETVDIPVAKSWNDADDQDGVQPESATVHLLANGSDTGKTLTLSADNEWKASFEGLPAYQDRQKIAYTVTEDPVAGYTATVTGDAESGFTATNAHEPATTAVKVTKSWVGPAADKAVVHLYADGADTGRSLELTEQGAWSGSFEGLPVYANGRAIAYTVAEDAVSGYSSHVAGSAGEGFVVTNISDQTTSVKVTKAWDDGNDADGVRPDSVTVRLLADGQSTGKSLQLSVGQDGTWQGSFEGLRVYDADDGHKISYTIAEDAVEGYTSTVAGDAESGFTVTNTHAFEATSVSVEKKWAGPVGAPATVRLYANGAATGLSAVLSADNGWSASFGNLPVRVNGAEVSYTVSEDPQTGYESAVAGSADNGFTITNTSTETVSVPVEKHWVGPAGDAATVRLLADGADAGKSLELTAGTGWKGAFEGLPRYAADGHEVAYTVAEDEVAGYACAITGCAAGGFSITNTSTATVNVPVSKSWDDGNDADGVRPASVTVRLIADGAVTDTVLGLTADTGWQGAFTGLPKYAADGHEVAYTVAEEAVAGYTSQVSGDAASGFAITNARTPETVSVPVTKRWVGPEGAAATVRLFADGADTGRTLVLDAADDWSGTFTGVPAKSHGRAVAYTVAEDAQDGYGVIVTGDADAGFTVTNVSTETRIVPVVKSWDDADDQDGMRPSSVTVRLTADGADTGQVLELTADAGWKGAFEGLPRYSAADGHEIAYTVVEDAVAGYASTVTGDAASGFAIANVHVPETVSIPVSKSWVGRTGYSATLHLYADGVDTGSMLRLTAAKGWKGSFDNLPKCANGKAIAYTVVEDPLDGFNEAIASDGEGGFTVVNALKRIPQLPVTDDKVDIPVSKAWQGTPAGPVTVRLYVDGADTGKSLVLDEGNGWKGTFEDVPTAKDGKAVSYTVAEDEVEGWTPTVSGGMAIGYTITNVPRADTIDIPVAKSWDDGDDQDGLRPDSVTVHLLADGADTGQSVTLDAGNVWASSFAGLRVYDANDGHKIAYTVTEDAVEGYTSEITGDAESGFTVTNAHEPATTAVKVTKSWVGPAADKAVVHLYADGADTGRSLELTEQGAWSGSFEGLPVYANGRAIAYTVAEDAVPGYRCAIAGSAGEGFTLTNINEATADVKVTKVWNDDNDARGVRPDSVTVHLWADGADTGKELTLDSSNGWASAFSGLPVYDATDGHAIAYTVREGDMRDYTSAITGDAASGFIITNTVKPDTGTPPGSPGTDMNVNVSVSGGSGSATTSSGAAAPATGDTIALGAVIAVVVAAGAVVAIAAYRRRKGNQDK